jgi:hypothetical protein
MRGLRVFARPACQGTFAPKAANEPEEETTLMETTLMETTLVETRVSGFMT